MQCPPGYIAGDGASTGCCFECVPDPDYCQRPVDCVLAKHVPDCCGCLRGISKRHYEADLCFSALGETRPVPPECGTPSDCDGDCPCPVADEAWCVNGTCSEIELDLK
jgi:hypothetical protein